MSGRLVALATVCGALTWSTPTLAATNFTPPVFVGLYAVGSPLVEDFDGSGTDDVAVRGDNGTVTVFLGDGQGGFSVKGSYSTGVLESAAGDFDGDGDVDLAVTKMLARKIAILLNDGAGAFSPGAEYDTAEEPTDVAVGDLTGDGVIDLAYTHYQHSPLAVRAGAGDGTFGAAASYALRDAPASTGWEPSNPVIADLNNDSRQDIAVVDRGLGAVTALYGQSDGTLGGREHLDVGGFPIDLVTLDVNGDGHADLATANSSSQDVSILASDDEGELTLRDDQPAGLLFTSWLISSDWNGDGFDDLAVSDTQWVRLLTSDGIGAVVGEEWIFALDPFLSTGSIAAGEFNGDSEPDIVVAGSHHVNVLFGDPVLIEEDLAFADHEVGAASETQDLVVENVGVDPVVLGTVTLSGADPGSFEVMANGCATRALDPGDTCAISIRFTPAAPGDLSAEVEIDSDSPVAPHVGFVSGTASPAPAALTFTPAALDFGPRQIGTSTDLAAVIRNTGGSTATVDRVYLGSGFGVLTKHVDGCSGAKLAPGDTCSVTVRFSPTASLLRTYAARLDVESDAPGSPHTMEIRAHSSNRLSLSPATLELSDGLGVATSPTGRLTLTSTPRGRRLSYSMALVGADSGAFRYLGGTCAAACTIDLGFEATRPGRHAATLRLTAGDQTLTAELVGTGIFPAGVTTPRKMLRERLRQALGAWRRAPARRRILERGFFYISALRPPTDGRLALRIGAGGRVLARGSVQVQREGGRARVLADLTRAGRAALRRERAVRATAVLTFRSGPARRAWSARGTFRLPG